MFGGVQPVRVAFEGPSAFARQLDAANALMPAEAVRSSRAVLLICGDAAGVDRAEEALRRGWGVDEVDVIRIAGPSWCRLDADPGRMPWLRALLRRAIRCVSPAKVAVLEQGRGEEAQGIDAILQALRSLGQRGPVVAIRVDDGGPVSWRWLERGAS